MPTLKIALITSSLKLRYISCMSIQMKVRSLPANEKILINCYKLEGEGGGVVVVESYERVPCYDVTY